MLVLGVEDGPSYSATYMIDVGSLHDLRVTAALGSRIDLRA